VNGTFSGSCPGASFCISGAGHQGSAVIIYFIQHLLKTKKQARRNTTHHHVRIVKTNVKVKAKLLLSRGTTLSNRIGGVEVKRHSFLTLTGGGVE
jgi:hypothetical protein